MFITMVATRDGSEDGFSAKTYISGNEYDVGEALAFSFIAGGDAVLTGDPKSAPLVKRGRGRK